MQARTACIAVNNSVLHFVKSAARFPGVQTNRSGTAGGDFIGARPSSGEASTGYPHASDSVNAPWLSYVAAPEDGRAPPVQTELAPDNSRRWATFRLGNKTPTKPVWIGNGPESRSKPLEEQEKLARFEQSSMPHMNAADN